MMLGVHWIVYQLSHAVHHVWTPVFDRALVIINPSYILENVEFHLPDCQITCDACHILQDAISVFEAWEMQSSVFFIQHVVIVRLDALLLDPTQDIFVLCTGRKQVVGIVLYVCLKATLSVSVPCLNTVITQRSTSTGQCFRLGQRMWQWS
jgi:hypothetical protein